MVIKEAERERESKKSRDWQVTEGERDKGSREKQYKKEDMVIKEADRERE